MTAGKIHWARSGARWHRTLSWVGAVTLLIFGLSGLSHPLMTWFGPQQAAFFPPQGEFSAADMKAVPTVLAANGIVQAQLIKVIPTVQGNLLQVSAQDGRVRRYFRLDTAEEVTGFDRQQGEWLARYYTGQAQTPVLAIQLQTEFDAAYPAINRLLPVWRVDFDTPDQLTAFVHTELNALASLSNRTRRWQQNLFLALHTWSWLDGAEGLRVIVVAVLVAALTLLCVTGMVLTQALPSRQLPPARRWHRRLAWWLWLPLLAFSVSGLYHLLQAAGGSQDQPLRYPEAFTPELAQAGHWDVHIHAALNSLSLVSGPAGQLLYRLGEPTGRPQQMVGHHERFDGQATEKPARLIAADSGEDVSVSDEALVRSAATRHLDLRPQQILGAELVTAFSSDYDFRNKRLPVWRVAYDTGAGSAAAFIDPANGALVDHIKRGARWERLSFSHLHKWNFMTPLIGRQLRDALSLLVIACALGFTGVGLVLLLRRRQGRR